MAVNDVQLGPLFNQYVKDIEALAQKKVEVEIGGGDPELKEKARNTEYGLGCPEEPFMRPSIHRALRNMDTNLKEGGVDAVQDRITQDLHQTILSSVSDAKLAEEIADSVEVRVVE